MDVGHIDSGDEYCSDIMDGRQRCTEMKHNVIHFHTHLHNFIIFDMATVLEVQRWHLDDDYDDINTQFFNGSLCLS